MEPKEQDYKGEDQEAIAAQKSTVNRMDRVLNEVRVELLRATKLHGPMKSPHEGYAVILEELDELWDEVKVNTHGNNEFLYNQLQKMHKEAIQVAAMAMRFVLDCCCPYDDMAWWE